MKEQKEKLSLIDKLRIKREKEKEKRAEKLRAHLEETENLQQEKMIIIKMNEEIERKLKEREKKYDLLAEEFNAVQKSFSAFKESVEEV